jgi:hypothetical protein
LPLSAVMSVARVITVMFPDRIWRVIEEYEPYPADVALSQVVRQRLHSVVTIEAFPSLRAITLSVEELLSLEAWLSGMAGGPDAPREVRDRAGERHSREAAIAALERAGRSCPVASSWPGRGSARVVVFKGYVGARADRSDIDVEGRRT